MFDAADGWGALWDQDSGLHPAGVAYQQVFNWLNGASISPCVGQHNVWSCDLTRPGGYTARIVWSSTPTPPPYPVPPKFTIALDLTGNQQPISDGSVNITKAPILLESKSPQ
jgi:hypothetical protein